MVQITSIGESAEDVTAALTQAGYEVPTITVDNVPVEPEPAPSKESVPSKEPGEPAAAPTEGEIEAAPEPVAVVDGEVKPEGKSPRNGFKKKIQEKDSEIGQLRQTVEEQGRRLAELTAAAPKPAPAPVVEPPKPEAEPKWEDFENEPNQFAAFGAAQAKYHAKQLFTTQQEADAKRQREQAEQSAASAADQRWLERFNTAKAKYPDLEEGLKSPDFHSTPAMQVLIRNEFDTGAEILTYLVQNPAESQRIAALTQLPANATPAEAHAAMLRGARELGKIELQLTNAPPAAQPPPRSVAPPKPPPPSPVNPGATPGRRYASQQEAAEAVARNELSAGEYLKMYPRRT